MRVPRTNAAVSKVHTLFNCCILGKVKNMLTIRNVSKTYGRSAGKAVDNLSFEAKSGEIFGFLGPNGAGKATTIKMTTGVTIFYCNQGSF